MNELSDEQPRQIEDSRNSLVSTRRTVSPGMEEILHQPFHVLDHGFIRVVDYMGMTAPSSRPPECLMAGEPAKCPKTEA